MATEIVMPKWGLTMKEGKVTRWFKSEGQTVSKGEALFEVETSKITNVVESPVDGVLFQILVLAGETVPVQTVVAVVAEPGEAVEKRTRGAMAGPGEAGEPAAAKEAPSRGGEKKRFVPASPIARRLAKEWGIDLSRVPGTGPGGRITEKDVRKVKEEGASAIKASPKAVALAEKMGIDLAGVEGSGPGGRILKVDVLRAANPQYQPQSGGGTAVAATASQPGARAEEKGRPPAVIPMSGMRKVIADNMMASLHQSAQLTVFVEADITATKAFIDKLRDQHAGGEVPRVSYTSVIAFAVCRALRRHPLLNSHLMGDEIRLRDEVNLGIAVALDDGLIVPNIKDAGSMSLVELTGAIRQAVVKARNNQLSMDEIQGGTFTISNVSALGVDGFTPILNPPETGILGVGRAMEKAAVVDGQIAIRTLMTLSLTFDHRVVDGAPAMRFLRTLADLLEDPVMMLA